MNIAKCEISNLKDIFLYYSKLETSGELPNISGQSMILDAVKITLILEGLSPIETLEFSSIAQKYAVLETHCEGFTDEVKERYNIPEDTSIDIADYHKFFEFIKKDDKIQFGTLYNLLLEVNYDLMVVFSGTSLLSIIGSRLREIFLDENGLMSEQLYEQNKESVENKFIQLLVNGVFTNLNNKLNNEDKVSNEELDRMFYSRTEPESISLCKALIPFGGNINFISMKNEDDGLQKGMDAISDCNMYGIKDEIEFYFVGNSTFLSFFYMKVILGLNVTCSNLKEQLSKPTLFVDDFIIEKYEKRLNSFLSPILSWKKFVFEDEKYLNFYKLLFSSNNNTLKYFVKIKYSELDLVEEKINSLLELKKDEIENSDTKNILETLKELLLTVKNIIK